MSAPTTDHQPDLLTITEAAVLLRAPAATLRYWRHCNIGPRSFRLGRRVLYRRDDLHAWIDDQHRQDASRRANGALTQPDRLSASCGRVAEATEPQLIRGDAHGEHRATA
jgi:hypothetical protein